MCLVEDGEQKEPFVFRPDLICSKFEISEKKKKYTELQDRREQRPHCRLNMEGSKYRILINGM